MILIDFLVHRVSIFTGESESVGVNEKGDFEIFKEK